MPNQHTPLDQMSPTERAAVNAHLRHYIGEWTGGAEVPGRPVEAHLACREMRRQAEALVTAAAELAVAHRRADRLVDEVIRGCGDEGAAVANGILGWTEAQGLFHLVVGLLLEGGDAPTEEWVAQLKADHVDLLIGGER